MNPKYINDRRTEALGFINNPDSTPSQMRMAFRFLKQWGVRQA